MSQKNCVTPNAALVAAEAANATRAAADETVELTRQQEGWEAYRTYSAAESNAEAVRTSAKETAQVAFKQDTSAAELVYTDEVGEAQVTRREVEAQAQRDFVIASKQAMPQQAVARLEQEITTAQNSAASTFANVQPLAHLQTESQKRDRAWNEGDWATWLNQWMDSWTDGGWSAVVSSPEFGQILDAVDGFQAGFWNAMSFGLTTRIRNGLWGELAERNRHGFWFNLGTGVGTVAVIGLGMANPCGMSSLVMGGWRAYNGMQAFGGVLNAHDNFSQGHYFWGALDVVGVMFSTSQLLKACFAAGTPIRTADGSKPVENIFAGDYVLSRDENDPDGPILLKLVEETFVRTGRIWVLKLDGREIRTTSEHPFYARGKGWTAVAELTTNDVLLAEDGRWLPVEAVEDTGGYETVYNFRVADFHTYFIGGDGWSWSVWAHNLNCGDVARRAFRTRAAARNEPLRSLSPREVRQAFRDTGYYPSQHFIEQVTSGRSAALGIETLRDVERIIRYGQQVKSGREVAYILRVKGKEIAVIVDPKTKNVVTIRPGVRSIH